MDALLVLVAVVAVGVVAALLVSPPGTPGPCPGDATCHAPRRSGDPFPYAGGVPGYPVTRWRKR